MKLTHIAVLLALAAVSSAELVRFRGKYSDPCVAEFWVFPYPHWDCQPSRPEASSTVYYARGAATGASDLVLVFPAVPVTEVPIRIGDRFGLAPLHGDCANTFIASTDVITATAPIGADPSIVSLDFSSLATIQREFEDEPRKICYQSQTLLPESPTAFRREWIWTGLYFGVVWPGINVQVPVGCTSDAECLQHPGLQNPPVAPYDTTLLSPQMILTLRQQTRCCVGQNNRPGICINNNVQDCCGGVATERAVDKCCNRLEPETVRFVDDHCPCIKDPSGPINCPTGELCCYGQKFPEVNTTVFGYGGQCYNPAIDRCCNTGQAYNPGTFQCCSISGVQSLDVPCPCGNDTHCVGGQVEPSGQTNQRLGSMRCCFPTSPPLPSGSTKCDIYNNFPSLFDLGENGLTKDMVYSGIWAPGQNDYAVQRCAGVCVDTAFQICCNGNPCYGAYQRCCNDTCCHKYNEACIEALLPVRSAFNTRDFLVKYEGCTAIEALTSERAFWVFVVPTFLLIATLAALALVVVFANTVTSRSYSFVERLWIVFAVIAIVFALPTYFSPIYKYGVVAVVVALISILSAAARVKWLNILAVGATIVFVVYLFDPFHGNNYWTLSHLRLPNGNPWQWSSGVIHSIRGFWGQDSNDYCTWFYHGYFRLDRNLQDVERYDNPDVHHFGYCNRGWATALLVFEGLQLLVSLWLFALALLALILRFRKANIAPVEFEARPVVVDY